MEILQIAIAVGALIFIASLLALFAFFKGRLDLGERLNQRIAKDSADGDAARLGQRLGQVFKPLGAVLSRSTTETSNQERKLIQAGFRQKDAVLLFHSAQGATGIALVLALVGTGYMYEQPLLCGVLSLLGGAAIPDIWQYKFWS